MKPFDGNEYRKRVMTRLLDDFTLADPETGDPFLVCDVDAQADVAATRARIDAVVAFWQKDRNHPKYKGIAAQLVARRDDYTRLLTDPSARAQTLARVHGARARTDADAVAQLDKLAAALLKRHHGIPRSRVAALASIASSEGMTDTSFASWLAQHPLVDDVDPDGVAPWESSVRHQIRASLDELARTDPAAAPRCRTLLTFLGVTARADARELAAAHARLAARNRERSRDRVMTVTEDLLAQVATRLMSDGGVAAYLASLRADARDVLKPDLRRLAVLTGSLPASEMEAFSAHVVGLGWGFSPAEARDLVRAAAHEVHLAVEVGGEVDLIVCPSCDRPQSVGRRKTCSYCRAHLYLDCPACSTTIPAASEVCPKCAAPLAAWRAAQQAAPAAQAALDAGRIEEAARLANDALDAIDVNLAPAPLRAVAAAATAQLARADAMWAELHRDLGRGAIWSAGTSALWLERNAHDHPGPAHPTLPRDPKAMRALVEERQRVATSEAGRAAALAPQEAEQALGDVLGRYPDCPTALAALAALPLPPPRSVALTLVDGSAQLTWEPAAGASRNVRYRVERHVSWPPHAVGHTVVATTSTTHLEDTAAPAGRSVSYTVAALSGTRTSVEVSSGPAQFVHRDIEVLHVETRDGTVEVSWPAVGLAGVDVVVERAVDPASGLTVPTRRMRPREAGRLVDDDITYDVPYVYRVALAYRAPDGEVVRTPGRSVAVRLQHPPRPVAEMWATTDSQQRTTLAFQSPPSGEVRVYASVNGTVPFAGAAPSDVAHLERLAGGARLVGQGRRRVVDAHARGVVRYRAVTVVGEQVALGAELEHTAVARPSGLGVVADDGERVTVGFELPAGVTEAFVCWRRDRFVLSADEPAGADAGAGAAKVTNTKLSIDGGFTIAAPADGRGLFVSVFPALRTGLGAPVAAPVAATLRAREPQRVEVTYRVKVGGMLRKKLEVNVESSTGALLPPLALVGGVVEPDHAGAGRRLAQHPGGGTSVVLRVEESDFPPGLAAVRLFAVPAPGAVVTVVDPPAETRRLTR